MKKYLNIYFTALFIMLLTACDKQLDVLPLQSVDESVVLSSDQNVKKALSGAYDALSASSFLGGDVQFYAELLAADAEISFVGTFNQPREIFGKNILTNNSYVRNTWLAGYNIINICNNVLSAIDVVDDADKDRVRGEALFIRGIAYFEMVKLYAKPYSAGNVAQAKGLPIVLEPTRGIDESSYVSRATLEATYTQVLNDLQTAESLLPDENNVYATSQAAAAYLSRVHLQMANYAEARDAANRAINYGGSLTTTYAGAFNNDVLSDEDIFAIEVNDQDGANDMHLFWSIPTYGGRDGDVEIETKHLNMYEPGDARYSLFYTGNGAVRSGKWRLQYKNLPVIRLAEMYLTRAEGNFRLGTTIGDTPENDITRIRGRANLLPLVTLTLDAILKERKLELAHEGQGIHDAKRLLKTVDGLAYNADKLVFPIPQREIDANTNLDQNDGYF